MEKLEKGANAQQVIDTINALIDRVEGIRVRDRGPRSSRSMTRIDAWRAIHGDLKDKGHKEAAESLGLSYGQIYSARGTYTFKDVKKDEFKLADVTKLVAIQSEAKQG